MGITTDVHFTAKIYMEPGSCVEESLKPMWEFAVGPGHAGAFGPGSLDPSFGPEYDYVRGPGVDGFPGNLPPPHYQSFGHVSVTEEGELTVKFIDMTGLVLDETVLSPETQKKKKKKNKKNKKKKNKKKKDKTL